MSQVFLPLFLRPVRLIGDAGIPANFALESTPEEEAILLTREVMADPEIRAAIEDIGLPTMRVFSTEAEAEAAGRMVQILRPDSDVLTGRSRDGDGILVVVNPDAFLGEGAPRLEDMRRHADRPHPPALTALVPSWEASESQCEEMRHTPFTSKRADLEAAVIDILASIGNKEVLRDIQSAAEFIPGSYVSYLSISPEDLRGDDYQLVALDAEDSDLQGFLLASSQKIELPEVFSFAMDDVCERIRAERPELLEGDESHDESIEP